MALMALNWAFVFKIMAWYAGVMSEFFPPADNRSDPGLVAAKAIIMNYRLATLFTDKLLV